jgi:hypothetical protein
MSNSYKTQNSFNNCHGEAQKKNKKITQILQERKEEAERVRKDNIDRAKEAWNKKIGTCSSDAETVAACIAEAAFEIMRDAAVAGETK